MDFVMVLSTVILISTLATLVLAVGSYMAFRMRDRRRPVAAAAPTPSRKAFFVRYRPPSPPSA
jgi:hypothetical protein